MFYINNTSTYPYFNIALEEYVLKSLDKEGNCIILYQNRPSIIIGRHQNTIEEINSEYVRENDICVVRRQSGGGAVYHDLGNLNFTFIIKDQEDTLYDFKKYTLPIIQALAKMGVTAEFNSRNDLTIDGRKFSGNAQYLYKNKLLHHGTLLFNSELDVLQRALIVDAGKIESKGIKSIRSRVTNISEYMPGNHNMEEFRSTLLNCLIESEAGMEEYVLTDEDIAAVNKLVEEKYSTWAWNYGESPKSNFKKSMRFDGGKVEVFLDIERGGVIKGCKIYGDFLGGEDLSQVEKRIEGSKYEYDNLKDILTDMNSPKYFGNISVEEVMKCFF